MDGFVDLLDDLLALPGANDELVKEFAPVSEVSALDLVIKGDVDGLARLLQVSRVLERQSPRVSEPQSVGASECWSARALQADPSFAINARDPETGRSLLHEACARGNMEIVKLLLQKTDADLTLRTMLGRCTPLHLAVTNNYRPIVFLLLSHGADASSRDRFSCSPMHYVKSISVAKLLVQYGGKILDYNAKKKHAAESLTSCAEEIRKDHNLSTDERDAEVEVYKVLIKYMEKQAAAEYRVKLESLRQMKRPTKEPAAAPNSRRRRMAIG